jgi:transposase
MLIVETIARIRREHFIKGKTIKEIARDLKVSRNTVRKVLRSGETSFEYERVVQPRPKLGRWAAELDGLLAGNAVKAAREQLTLIRIFEELRGRGYDGGYDAVRRYARRWSKEHGQSTAAAYVPLSFAPGEAYQFDWSHEVVLLNGVTVIVKAAHVRLSHSRMLFVRAYPRETQEMVFDAHDRAFALFKGTCGRGIYDNMKTAVETIFVGKGRLYNRRFLQMCSHYLVDPVACTPASGWEKGQVENQVGLVRERFFTPRLRFKTLDELNAWLLDKCIAYAKAHRHPELPEQTIWEVFEARTAKTRSLCRPLRRIPCGAGLGVEDLPRALRQQQILGHGQCRRTAGRSPCLRRPHRNPPGRTDRCRASALIRARRDDLRSLALRPARFAGS